MRFSVVWINVKNYRSSNFANPCLCLPEKNIKLQMALIPDYLITVKEWNTVVDCLNVRARNEINGKVFEIDYNGVAVVTFNSMTSSGEWIHTIDNLKNCYTWERHTSVEFNPFLFLRQYKFSEDLDSLFEGSDSESDDELHSFVTPAEQSKWVKRFSAMMSTHGYIWNYNSKSFTLPHVDWITLFNITNKKHILDVWETDSFYKLKWLDCWRSLEQLQYSVTEEWDIKKMYLYPKQKRQMFARVAMAFIISLHILPKDLLYYILKWVAPMMNFGGKSKITNLSDTTVDVNFSKRQKTG